MSRETNVNWLEVYRRNLYSNKTACSRSYINILFGLVCYFLFYNNFATLVVKMICRVTKGKIE